MFLNKTCAYTNHVLIDKTCAYTKLLFGCWEPDCVCCGWHGLEGSVFMDFMCSFVCLFLRLSIGSHIISLLLLTHLDVFVLVSGIVL